MIKTFAKLTLFLASLSLATPQLAAQCAPPDGLDGLGCCSTAQLHVPLPKFTQNSLGICWRDCNVDATQNYTAIWSGLYPALAGGGPACAWFQARVRLLVGGVLHWSGAMQVTYARTWVETDSSGIQTHVWRFLANGDMWPTASAGPAPCPRPTCIAGTTTGARFTGYIDYAYSCGTSTWENAWMLTHSCDSIDHAPGFPRSGAFHPDRSYTFVGPALGFVPSTTVPPEVGGSGFENIRAWKIPTAGSIGPVACIGEERINNASISPTAGFCQCGVGPNQFVSSNLSISGACGTTIASIPGTIGFLSMSLGSWTLPGNYPGIERLRWNAGQYLYNDACTGISTTDYFFGVTTMGGNAANQYLGTGIGAPLPLTFIDQASSMRLPGGTTVRNIPYLSDHIFSLNF